MGRLASWHFCPTFHSADNLEREGIAPSTVEVTGNTVVAALHLVVRALASGSARPAVVPKRARQRVLVTLHRRETKAPRSDASAGCSPVWHDALTSKWSSQST